MNEMEAYSLKTEEKQGHNRELFYLLHKLPPKYIVVRGVEVLNVFLDSYKRGINECAERPEMLMKLLQNPNKVLRKRGHQADRRKKSFSAERQKYWKSQQRNNRRSIASQQYKRKVD